MSKGSRQDHQAVRRAFTMIELLVVIAIIAILAGIIYPVFSRAREATRSGSCMGNLHAIYVGANLYKDDYEVYPPVLLGVAERPDGLPWKVGDPGPVPISRIKHGFLYPRYVKSPDRFICPANPLRKSDLPTTASYPSTSPWAATLNAAIGTDQPTFGAGAVTIPGLLASYANVPVSFYALDSYDITSLMGADGKRVGSAFQIAYSKDWNAARARGLNPRNDAPNQLMYNRSLPAGSTMLTMCNYHVTTAGTNMVNVLLASGTAKPYPYKDVLAKGWDFKR